MWKSIPDYVGYYAVSNLGRIRSYHNKAGKRNTDYLTPTKRPDGYLSVKLSKNGVGKCFLIHRLVANAFIPNSDHYEEVNHKDENKENNSVDNLEWCDRLYNVRYGTGSERMGKAHRKAVVQMSLDNEQIHIWSGLREAASELEMKHQSISRVCNGKQCTAGGFKWRFVEGGYYV